MVESHRGTCFVGGVAAPVGSVNSAEMFAAHEGLKAAFQRGLFDSGDNFVLYTDSTHVVGRLIGHGRRRRVPRHGFLTLCEQYGCTYLVEKVSARQPKSKRNALHKKIRQVDQLSRDYMVQEREARGYSHKGEDLNGLPKLSVRGRPVSA